MSQTAKDIRHAAEMLKRTRGTQSIWVDQVCDYILDTVHDDKDVPQRVPVLVEYSDEFAATCIVGVGCLVQGNPFKLEPDDPSEASVVCRRPWSEP